MSKKKKLDLEDFKKFEKIYKNFDKIDTYTKEKRKHQKELLNFFDDFEFASFQIRYPLYAWEFTITKIPANKRGFLEVYRNKTVLILITGSYAWKVKSLLVVECEDEKFEALIEKFK